MKNDRRIYSVGQINSYVKRLIQDDFILNNLSVRGEISNCKYHYSGHIYFSLKDETGVLSCVMFASSARNLRFKLADGMQVIVSGSVSVYERDGRYQLYAREIEEAGKGDLFRQFEELKNRLEEMGMFAPEYKKPVPEFASRIGVATAETGAVIRDIYNVASRRNPYSQIILCPCQVQGEGAAESICNAIERLDKKGLDCIIVGRGGGSIEDLWCFNDERVARTVFNCVTPVISAVGHETDYTICDFVADLRAPTPSAAAELAVFDYDLFCRRLSEYKNSFLNSLNAGIRQNKDSVKRYLLLVEKLSPENRLREYKKDLEVTSQRLIDLMDGKAKEYKDRVDKMNELLTGTVNAGLEKNKAKLGISAERLEGLSPLKRLLQGYSFASLKGVPVKNAASLKTGDQLTVDFADGSVLSIVDEIKLKNG